MPPHPQAAQGNRRQRSLPLNQVPCTADALLLVFAVLLFLDPLRPAWGTAPATDPEADPKDAPKDTSMDAPKDSTKDAPRDSAKRAAPAPLQPDGSSTTDPEPSPGRENPGHPLDPPSNAFGFALYKAIRSGGDNLFLSPHSLHQALAMTLEGAEGETRRQMLAVLHLPDNEPARHRILRASQTLQPQDPDTDPVTLTIANRLWGQAGFPFAPSFVDALADRFGAEAQTLDFSESDAAAARINAWVKTETRGRIEQLASPGSLNRNTRLVLTNAVYFLGTWEQPFRETATTPRPFRTFDRPASGDVPRVPMMRMTGWFLQYADAVLQAIRLRYSGGLFEMVALLPQDTTADGFDALEAWMSCERLAAMERGFAESRVELMLPKWKLAWEGSLAKPLAGLGMPDVFDAHKADLSKMHAEGARDVFVSEVLQKAAVDVTESGTEAAAATSVLGVTTADPSAQQPPIPFHADRPFLYWIRHVPSGTILFLGRMMMPEGYTGSNVP